MESEVVMTEMVLAPTLPFKKMQTADKYPKGQSRGRQWKHLRHLLQSADASSMPLDRPNWSYIEGLFGAALAPATTSVEEPAVSST